MFEHKYSTHNIYLQVLVSSGMWGIALMTMLVLLLHYAWFVKKPTASPVA